MSASIDPDRKNGGPATNNSGRRYSWETYPSAWNGPAYRGASIARRSRAVSGRADVIMNFAAFQDAPRRRALRKLRRSSARSDVMLQDIRRKPASGYWIVPPYDVASILTSCPPPQNYVRRILDAFGSNPKVWSRTAFIIVYDENDACSTTSSRAPPPGTPGDTSTERRSGWAFACPASSSRRSHAAASWCGDTFDHTSDAAVHRGALRRGDPPTYAVAAHDAGSHRGFGSCEPADPASRAPPTADAPRLVEQQIERYRIRRPSIQAMPKPEVAGITRRRRAPAPPSKYPSSVVRVILSLSMIRKAVRAETTSAASIG